MRRRPALIPIGLALLSVAEIAAFAAMVTWIGGGWAVLLLLALSLAGMSLLRREGIKGWRSFQAAAAEGRPPGHQVVNSLTGLLGALLLAVPGFVTAVIGLVLLLPPGRTLARRQIERYAERRVGAEVFGPRFVRVRRGDAVDAEVVDATPGPDPVRTPAAAIEGEVVDGEVLR